MECQQHRRRIPLSLCNAWHKRFAVTRTGLCCGRSRHQVRAFIEPVADYSGGEYKSALLNARRETERGAPLFAVFEKGPPPNQAGTDFGKQT